jgi:hypothetical protein
VRTEKREVMGKQLEMKLRRFEHFEEEKVFLEKIKKVEKELGRNFWKFC